MEPDGKVEKPRKKGNRFFYAFLILFTIIVVFAGLFFISVIARYDGYPHPRKDAKFQIKNFETALELYFTDNGAYPTTKQGLPALVTAPDPKPKNYPPDGYMNSIPSDPWGNAYIYRSPGAGHRPYTIESLGADGVVGGEGEDADIESWNLKR